MGDSLKWSRENLTKGVTPSGGYTRSSDAVKNLIDIVLEFEPAAQSRFLEFVTAVPTVGMEGVKFEVLIACSIPKSLQNRYRRHENVAFPAGISKFKMLRI
jgi:hypothetical protein